MRTRIAVLSLTVTLACFADTRAFNLMEIAHIGGKGRIQDQKERPNDPQVTAILAMGKEAIPILIEALESERSYKSPPLEFWPKMVEGIWRWPCFRICFSIQRGGKVLCRSFAGTTCSSAPLRPPLLLSCSMVSCNLTAAPS